MCICNILQNLLKRFRCLLIFSLTASCLLLVFLRFFSAAAVRLNAHTHTEERRDNDHRWTSNINSSRIPASFCYFIVVVIDFLVVSFSFARRFSLKCTPNCFLRCLSLSFLVCFTFYVFPYVFHCSFFLHWDTKLLNLFGHKFSSSSAEIKICLFIINENNSLLRRRKTTTGSKWM